MFLRAGGSRLDNSIAVDAKCVLFVVCFVCNFICRLASSGAPWAEARPPPGRSRRRGVAAEFPAWLPAHTVRARPDLALPRRITAPCRLAYLEAQRKGMRRPSFFKRLLTSCLGGGGGPSGPEPPRMPPPSAPLAGIPPRYDPLRASAASLHGEAGLFPGSCPGTPRVRSHEVGVTAPAATADVGPDPGTASVPNFASPTSAAASPAARRGAVRARLLRSALRPQAGVPPWPGS